jgi:polar amino acid transport system substrate-binding protein
MKRHAKLWALPIAAALALSVFVPVLASSPANSPDAPPAQSTPVPTRGLSIDDLAKTRSSGKLLVGVSADYPPYAFYNSDYKIDGFEPALIGDLAKRIGAKQADLNDFAFEGLLDALRLGQVDVAIAAISDTPARRELVDFTNVYYIGADAVLGPSDAISLTAEADLAGKRVGAQKGSVYATFLKEALVDKGLSKPTDVFLYSDITKGVADLKDGKLDYVMMDRLPARSFAASEDLTVVGENYSPQRFVMGVRKGSSLRGALNDALLRAQNDGAVAKLIETYLGLKSNQVEPIPPATPAPTPTPGPTATPAGPPPCVNGAAYVADLNLDDQNMTAPPIMQPGQTFRKGWRLRNSGNCNWRADFFLGFVFGNTPGAQMGGQPTAVGRTIAPGQTADIFVNLVAPGQPGTYQGFWQMNDSNGTPFGERVWVGIQVPNPNPPAPVPPTPVPGISFTANPTTINQGQCTTFNWNVQGVQGVWFFPAGQPYQNYGVPGVSSQQQCPQQTTTYYLRVQFNDGSVQQPSIVITVNPVAGGPVISQFTVDPSQISAGQCVTARWQVTGNVVRVAILSNGQVRWDGAPATGNWNDCPQSPGVVNYAIQAFASDGTAVQTSRDVSVSPAGAAPPVINSFTADEQTVAFGNLITLRWDVGGGATKVQINRNYRESVPLSINSSVLNGYTYDDTKSFFQPQQGTQNVGYVLTACNNQGQCVNRDIVVSVTVQNVR